MDPWLVTTIASGVLLAIFGGLLLATDPKRDWNRVFALFAVFWGLQIVVANAVRLTDNLALAHVFATLTLALLIPLYFFLMVFASIFPRPRPPFATSWTALLLLLVPAASSLAILLVAPRLLLAGVVAVEGGGATIQWGPLFPPLVLAPLYGGFLYALFIMLARLNETKHLIERRQVLLVLIALGLFVAYNVPLQSILFGSAVLGATERNEAPDLTGTLIGAIMLAGLLLLGLVARDLARIWRHESSRTAAREARWALAALALAAVVGATEGLVDVVAGIRLQVVGIVRTVATGLVVYGIARYQLFDLDLRMKNAVPTATTVILAGVAGVAIWSLLQAIGIGTVPRIVLITGIVLLFSAAVGFVFRRLADRIVPHVARRGDHLMLRKLEVYRAALEAPNGEAGLTELAQRLGLDEKHRQLAQQIVDQRAAGLRELVPGVLAFDRYLVEACIGRGAYGRVFLARDTHRARHVVIKELEARWRGDKAVLELFLREARIMGRLRHRNITSLLEVERRGDDHYLVMEHVEGGTLAERLEQGKIDPMEAVRLGRELASALAAAHERRIVHRDLKPANVLLDLDGRAKLADFGVACLFGEDREETLSGLPPPEEHGSVGNLQYMAPEQARGEATGPSADIYALGALLYHMVTGQAHRDFKDLDPETARDLVAGDAVPRLDTVPSWLHAALQRFMATDPRQRPADGQVAGTILAQMQATAPVAKEGSVAGHGYAQRTG